MFNEASKDGVPHDWYVEGPGRRVGYEDLTAIDWIFEYTKERQRLRMLYSSASGVIGYVRRLIDASQVWIVLLLTGMLVGTVAAVINVTTDWLGDLKEGYCASGPEGGHFYLNKAFCCYGYDQGSKCDGWKTWGDALGVHSKGGKWFIEYFFFVSFAVCTLDPRNFYYLIWLTIGRCCLHMSQHFSSRNMPSTQSTVVFQKSRLFWGASSFDGSLDSGHSLLSLLVL